MVLYIGLSGTIAAGKGVVKSAMEERYKTLYFSCSDILREEADKRNIERTRKNLTDIGNELRKLHGPGVLAEKIIDRLSKLPVLPEIVIIDSIRNPGEVSMLRYTLKKYFFLLFVDAPLEIRYKRTLQRKREGESADSFENFSRVDKAEFEGDDERGIQLKTCKMRANKVIENSGTAEQLKEDALRIIRQKIDEFGMDSNKRG